MKLFKFILFGLIIIPFMNCNKDKHSDFSKIKTVNTTLKHVFHPVPSPDKEDIVIFDSVRDWCLDLCKGENPKFQISNFNFGLIESEGDYIVYVVGRNIYREQDKTIDRIDFEPTQMYFELPKQEFGNLDRDQVIKKLHAQLKDIINTTNFKTSFFAKAEVITLCGKDVIWKR